MLFAFISCFPNVLERGFRLFSSPIFLAILVVSFLSPSHDCSSPLLAPQSVSPSPSSLVHTWSSGEATYNTWERALALSFLHRADLVPGRRAKAPLGPGPALRCVARSSSRPSPHGSPAQPQKRVPTHLSQRHPVRKSTELGGAEEGW